MNKNKVWSIVLVVIAIVLLLYWLFAGTLIEETGEFETLPEFIDQTN
ncbi:MAG: hypothetical protein PUB21_09690 [Bacteroidales bacterium]|nr:hypothetical protein [Bacteroidales bacterium]